MAKWLLIDGFNLAYRCFFAVPELTRADGFPTNALHGWVKSLWRLSDQEKPYATLVFFDLGGAQDRLALHPGYKAQREEMPEALRKQIEPLKALTRAMGYVGIEVDGVESDDLLASQAVALAGQGHDVVIVSADKDFAQIVGDMINILLPPPIGQPKTGVAVDEQKWSHRQIWCPSLSNCRLSGFGGGYVRQHSRYFWGWAKNGRQVAGAVW